MKALAACYRPGHFFYFGLDGAWTCRNNTGMNPIRHAVDMTKRGRPWVRTFDRVLLIPRTATFLYLSSAGFVVVSPSKRLTANTGRANFSSCRTGMPDARPTGCSRHGSLQNEDAPSKRRASEWGCLTALADKSDSIHQSRTA